MFSRRDKLGGTNWERLLGAQSWLPSGVEAGVIVGICPYILAANCIYVPSLSSHSHHAAIGRSEVYTLLVRRPVEDAEVPAS
jgi:hypothetical protein